MAEEQISVKISELTETTSFNDDDELPLVQDGTTKKIKRTKVVESIKADLGSAAQAESTDFEPAGSVAGVEAQLVETSNQQNERIERLEYSIYLIQKNGVFKAYRTKALMLADVANIPVNSIVSVVNDPANNAESNNINGEYHYNGTDFFKLPNNLLDQLNIKTAAAEANAKSYADVKKAEAIQTAAFDAQIKADEVKDFAQAEINNLGISNSGVSNGSSVQIVDEDDNRTWLEADGAGKPTNYSKSLILESLDDGISEKVQGNVSELGFSNSDTSNGPSVQIVDEDDNRTWLEADEAGKPTGYAAQKIAEAIEPIFGFDVIPTHYKSTYQGTSKKIVSGPDIVCWGDSMMFGAGSTGVNCPNYLKTLISNSGKNVGVYNGGVGGESSIGIAARANANPFIVKPFTIPADTSPVTITFEKINDSSVYPLYQGAGNGNNSGWGASLVRYFDGEIAGVKGRISLVQPSAVGNVYTPAPDDYYTFTRAAAGSSVSVTRPSPFYLDYAKEHWGDIHIIWIGQNNGTDQDRAIADAKAIINKMNALDKRYIVISKPVSSTEPTTKAERDALDAKFFAEFGRRFIPIRQYLIEYGLQDAGITATAQDNIDIANGTVPSSLRSDGVHFKEATYKIVAQQVFNRLTEFGWI